jgi:hypothetical protein
VTGDDFFNDDDDDDNDAVKPSNWPATH